MLSWQKIAISEFRTSGVPLFGGLLVAVARGALPPLNPPPRRGLHPFHIYLPLPPVARGALSPLNPPPRRGLSSHRQGFRGSRQLCCCCRRC